MSERKVLVIDGNNYFSRMFFYITPNADQYFSQIIERFLTFKENKSDHRIIMTFDTCKSKRRLELFPQYKEGRHSSLDPEVREAYIRGMNLFIEIIKASGFMTLDGADYEADDYIACVAEMLRFHNKVTIVSTDQDLYQLVKHNIVVYDPIKMIEINDENFEYVTELKQKYYLTYKCLVGDNSDKIPGVYGVGDKTAKKLIEEHGSLQEILNAIAVKQKRTKREEDIINNLDILNRNRKLMSLEIPIKDKVLQERIKNIVQAKHCLNKDILHKILGENNLGNLFKNIIKVCHV